MKTSNTLLNLLLVTLVTFMLSACNTKTNQDENSTTTSPSPTTQTTGDSSVDGGVTGGTNAGTNEGTTTSTNGGAGTSSGGSSLSTGTTADSGDASTTENSNDSSTSGGSDDNVTTGGGNDDNTSTGGGSDDNSTTNIDTTPPVITLNGESSITLEQNAVYTELGATALDAVDGNVSVTISGTVDTATVGSYTVTYSAQDSAGNEVNITRSITIIDVTPPVITLNGEESITLEQNAVYTELGATALDGVDGNVSVTTTGNVDTATVGSYAVTYSATDSAGNEANATRTITVIDVTPPVITLNGESNITLEQNTPYTELGATALDAVDGNVSVAINGTVDTSTIGNYTVMYTAQDSAGNEANITRSITVIDVTPPVIALNGEANITLEQNAVYTELGATALDAVDGNVSVTINGNVDTATVGSYTVTYTATDSAGNEANVTRRVEVINTTPTLSSITIESNATTVNIGESIKLSVMGTYSDSSNKSVDENITYIITPNDSAEMNGSMLIVQKDGNVTVQATVGGVKSNTLNLTITWTVNGHTLPPEPDKVMNDSTLLGIDVNDNGVRDDVERWIYETYNEYIPCHQELDWNNTVVIRGKTIPSAIEVCEDNPVPYHPVVRAVAMQGARAAQIIIQEPEKARETREVFSKAYLCSIVVDDKKDLNGRKMYKEYIFGDEFKKIQFNTIKRARAFGEYNFNLSGGVYDLPTDDVILQGCSMEVHKLLEGLK